jgi:cobalt-zinc-cadmium resistance protein CzcA
MKKTLLILSCVACLQGHAQTETLTLEQAVNTALKNNVGLKSASYEVEATRQLRKTSFDLPKTNVSFMYGQYNSYASNDNNLTITQTVPFAALGSLGHLNRALVASSELNKAMTENDLIFHVKRVYYQIAHSKATRLLLIQEDTILSGFLKSASIRYKTGEANLLEKTTAETRHNEVRNRLLENETNTNILRSQLMALLNSGALPDIDDDSLSALHLDEVPDTTSILSNPSLAFARQQVEVAKSNKRVESARMAPDLLVGYFNQTLIGAIDTESGTIANKGDRFSGVQLGLSIPLWFVPQQGRVKSADLTRQAAASKYKYDEIRFQSELRQASELHARYSRSLEYYQTSALPNANLILRQFHIAFQNGEIGFAEYLLGVQSALNIKERHLQTLSEYNQNVIYIQYLSGNK